MKGKTVAIFMISLICQFSLAQEIQIKEMKETVSGSDAFNAPVDNNGHPCGLVKVLTTIDDLSFVGNVIGNVENKTNEYHVFLAQGSTEVVIKRPHVLPLVVKFADYNIEEIVSKATYSITLKEVKLNAVKNSIVINMYPKKAKVYIDEMLLDNQNGSGSYQLLLPKGEHIFRFEENGYRSMAQVVKVGKGAETLNIELESLLAELDVKCQTSTAELWINDEKIGIGEWIGKLPAGDYVVEAKQKDYETQKKEISLEEKEKRSISIPQLKRAVGRVLFINPIPNSKIFIDGKMIVNSQEPVEVETGQHTVIAQPPFGYKEGKMYIDVHGGALDTISIDYEPLNNKYKSAFEGDVNTQLQLALEFETKTQYDETDSIERNYWYDKVYENLNLLDESTFLSNYQSLYYHYMDNKTKALTILLHRVNLNKKWDDDIIMVYSDIANIYESLHDYVSALVWRKKVVEEEEDYYSSLLLARAYEQAGDVPLAIEWNRKTLRHLGDAWLLWNWYDISVEIADSFLRLGANKDAATMYRQLINKHPNHEKVGELRKKLKQTGY